MEVSEEDRLRRRLANAAGHAVAGIGENLFADLVPESREMDVDRNEPGPARERYPVCRGGARICVAIARVRRGPDTYCTSRRFGHDRGEIGPGFEPAARVDLARGELHRRQSDDESR